jgi:CRP-like cAMP-binding protein
MNTRPPAQQIENRILSGLPPQELNQLLPTLEPFPLVREQGLYEIDARIDYVYFPDSGMISLVSYTEDGESLEVGVAGYEGMAGLPTFLDVANSPYRAMVQIEGTSHRMKADAFKAAARQPGAFQLAMLRYTQALMTQFAQSAVCNRFHNVEARLARWLLLTKSRVRADQFYLTQEFLGQMIGTHRPAVTVAAGILQSAGLIRYRRGNITIVDQEGLEAASCECYRIVVKALNLTARP